MRASTSLPGKHIFTFGPYRLRSRERILEREGKPVTIPEKTLEVLCVLVENHGELMHRKTLMQKAWPDTFVEDSNIAFQISTLRKLLDETASSPKFVETVPKRGYRFIAEVIEELEPAPVGEAVADQPPPLLQNPHTGLCPHPSCPRPGIASGLELFCSPRQRLSEADSFRQDLQGAPWKR